MTEEEKLDLAIDWIRSQGWNEETLPSDELLQMEKAFIAGLKAGRPKWHKVEEKLPPLWEGCERTSIRVVDNYNRIITYDYDSERWRDLEGDSLGIQPDYWYEIPQFKE